MKNLIKIRLEYADNERGQKELQKVSDILEQDFNILNNIYKRIYVDIKEQ